MMKSRVFFYTLFVALMLVWVIPASTEAMPRINLNPTNIDFGSIRVGENRSRVVTISNSGTSPLICNIDPASPFISVSQTRLVVNPGQSVSLHVVFRATGSNVGERSGSMVLNTNAGIRYVSWRASVVPFGGGSGMPPLPSQYNQGVSDTHIDFGEIEPGERTRHVTLFNPFPYPIRVRIEAGAPWIRLPYAYVTIPPFGSHMLPITIFVDYFPDEILEGFVTLYFPWGAVRIVVNARRPADWYPYPYYDESRLYIAPTRIDFGTVWHGTTEVRSFLIRNRNPYPVRVRILDTAPWLRVMPYEAYIEPHGSRSFRVTVNGSLIPPGTRRAYIFVDTPFGRKTVLVIVRGGF